MRALRNIAIIALIAVPVAFLPGGGQAAQTVITALTMAFLATLVLFARELYRQNRLTIDTLPDGQRAVLFGALGVIVLMIAGADEMLGTGGGTVLWIGLLALSVLAIVRVWTEARSY
jgi:hypothetical protein